MTPQTALPGIKHLLLSGQHQYSLRREQATRAHYVSWANSNNWNPEAVRPNAILTWLLVATWISYKKAHPVNEEDILKFLHSGRHWKHIGDVSALAFHIWSKYFPEIPIS